MTRKEELLEEAMRLYKHGDIVDALIGEFVGNSEMIYRKHEPYSLKIPTLAMFQSHYDPIADTFAVWGYGAGLIYRKGEWATHHGVKKETLIPVIINNYSIF